MSLLRKINLIEVLKEEAEAAGLPLPPDITEQQLEQWNDEDIKQYFTQHSQQSVQQNRHVSPDKVLEASTSAATLQTPGQQPCKETQHQSVNGPQLRDTSNNKRTFPRTSPKLLSAWFPGLRSPTAAGTVNPEAVILCFHSAGCAEDMFTSEGTGCRKAVSPLLEAAKANNWQIMASQLPGRGLRRHEPFLETLQDVAHQLLPLVCPAIEQTGGQYAIVAHSMGCWAAYELLLALKAAGYPEPSVACLSAMPWPHIPLQQRPWRQQKTLGQAEFKEECRAWDIDELVFTKEMWNMYEPLLRSDFQLFDEYQPSVSRQQALTRPFSFPLSLFWGSCDRRVDEHMVQVSKASSKDVYSWQLAELQYLVASLSSIWFSRPISSHKMYPEEKL